MLLQTKISYFCKKNYKFALRNIKNTNTML